MKEFLDYLILQLVNNKEAYRLDEKEENGEVVYTINVDPADIGLIIGKEEKLINAIRLLVKIIAIKQNKRVSLVLPSPTA